MISSSYRDNVFKENVSKNEMDKDERLRHCYNVAPHHEFTQKC